MDYCKKCKNFGCNAAGTERTTTDCEDYMSHLPTNADRIRAMSDEELAEWATTVGRTFGEEYEGYMSALDWLKAPVEEVDLRG